MFRCSNQIQIPYLCLCQYIISKWGPKHIRHHYTLPIKISFFKEMNTFIQHRLIKFIKSNIRNVTRYFYFKINAVLLNVLLAKKRKKKNAQISHIFEAA